MFQKGVALFGVPSYGSGGLPTGCGWFCCAIAPGGLGGGGLLPGGGGGMTGGSGATGTGSCLPGGGSCAIGATGGGGPECGEG